MRRPRAVRPTPQVVKTHIQKQRRREQQQAASGQQPQASGAATDAQQHAAAASNGAAVAAAPASATRSAPAGRAPRAAVARGGGRASARLRRDASLASIGTGAGTDGTGDLEPSPSPELMQAPPQLPHGPQPVQAGGGLPQRPQPIRPDAQLLSQLMAQTQEQQLLLAAAAAARRQAAGAGLAAPPPLSLQDSQLGSGSGTGMEWAASQQQAAQPPAVQRQASGPLPGPGLLSGRLGGDDPTPWSRYLLPAVYSQGLVISRRMLHCRQVRRPLRALLAACQVVGELLRGAACNVPCSLTEAAPLRPLAPPTTPLHPAPRPQILMRLEHQSMQLEELLQYLEQAQAAGHPLAAASAAGAAGAADAAAALPLPLQRLARQLLPAPAPKAALHAAARRAGTTRHQRSSALIANAFNVVRQPALGGAARAPAAPTSTAAGQGQAPHDPATCGNAACTLCAYQRGLQHAAVAQQLSQLVGDDELEALAAALAMEQQRELARQQGGR